MDAGDDVEIREATTDDLDAIVDNWTDLVADQRKHDSHLLADENESAARDVLSRYVVVNDVLVAEARTNTTAWNPGAVLGFVMYHIEDGLYEMDVIRGIVENVYVVPSARDRGIGSALMDRAERDLEQQGANSVSLSVMAANEQARRFYRERGYENHRVIMERTLDDRSE